MSKAFTSEENETQDVIPARVRPTLPPGASNYITRTGAEAFQAESQRLMEERAALLGSAAEDAKERLVRVDARLRDLQEIVGSALVVDAAPTEQDRVRFGACVRVREGNEETSYRIVGIDEVDLEDENISWLSPLAKALMNKHAGDVVDFATPGGKRRLEVLVINYA